MKTGRAQSWGDWESLGEVVSKRGEQPDQINGSGIASLDCPNIEEGVAHVG